MRAKCFGMSHAVEQMSSASLALWVQKSLSVRQERNNRMSRILLVEDDARIVGFIKRGLEAEGYVVDLVNSGEDALVMVRENPYSLIILDRVLPGIDGLEVCRVLHREQRKNLVLMLTAKDSLQDKVEGLKGGADDY